MSAKRKRKRGGQPGNQNARKHGFYAAGLTAGELAALWPAVNLAGSDLQVAALRVRLRAALRRGCLGPRLCRETARRLARRCQALYGLNSEGGAAIRKLVLRALEAAARDAAKHPLAGGP